VREINPVQKHEKSLSVGERTNEKLQCEFKKNIIENKIFVVKYFAHFISWGVHV
jgi:hypothetical protein